MDRLLTRSGHLERCMKMLQVTAPKAVLWQRIKALTKYEKLLSRGE